MDALLDTADLVKDEDLVGGGGGGRGGSGPGNPAKNPKQHALSKRLSEAATLEPADAAGARCTLARCVIITCRWPMHGVQNYLHGKCGKKLHCLLSRIMGAWLMGSWLFFQLD